MPFILEKQYFGVNRSAFHTWFDKNDVPYTVEEFSKVRRRMFIGMKPVDKNDVYNRGTGGGFNNGPVIVDPECFPLKVQINAKPERFPKLFEAGFALCVSESVKTKIEELEPGLHEFYPIIIELRDGQQPLEPYFLIKINSGGEIAYYNKETKKYETKYSRVIDRAIWVNEGKTDNYGVSDDMMDVIMSDSLKKLFLFKYFDWVS